MPVALTETQNDIVKAMLVARIAQKEIAEAARCHLCHVKQIKCNLRYWGTPTRTKIGPQGWPRCSTTAHMDIHPFTYYLKC